jgi:hypothetical protein
LSAAIAWTARFLRYIVGLSMRRIIWLFVFLNVWPLGGVAQPVANEADLSLADLVREVKVALLKVAEAVEAQHLPKLDKAELEVNTSIKTEADGKVSLWVVELGTSGNNEYATTVTLTLTPPPPGSPSNIAVVHLADALSEAILAGARAIQAAGEGNPPLLADELVASVRFAIVRDGNGKFGVKFPPFEASAGASVGTAQVQTITVTYKR